MEYRVEIADTALKALRKLPVRDAARIDGAILALAKTPRPRGVKRLQGQPDLYRVRVGDYRILYAIRDNRLLVLVVRIAHRRDAYRDL